MADRAPGLIGGMAAGRPVLSGAVIALAAAALAAVAYRQASGAYASVSVAVIAALLIATIFPAAVGAAAPKNFWLRAIYGGIIAGVLLALRRLALQSGVSLAPFDIGLILVIAAPASFFLALGASLWRSALALSLIGFLALGPGVAAGLSILAIETAREGAIAGSAPAIALASALGAALAVQIAAAFSRVFAEGGDNFAAAAAAARHAAAPALFSLALCAATISFIAFSAGETLAGVLASARVAAGAAAFSLVAVLVFSAGALALKAESEMTAVAENRRRAMLRPLLSAMRKILPPSSAIAASAIFLIIAVVGAFETSTPPAFAEIAIITVIALGAAIAFVSLRTALMIAVLAAASGRAVSWFFDLAGAAPPGDTPRVIAAALAAALSAQLFLAWRDRRHPRRKTREVAQLALADALFAYVAAAVISSAALAASEAAGLWADGVEAALYALILSAVGFFAAPPLMTAIGAIFGRD